MTEFKMLDEETGAVKFLITSKTRELLVDVVALRDVSSHGIQCLGRIL
jgi:hypothetical protein